MVNKELIVLKLEELERLNDGQKPKLFSFQQEANIERYCGDIAALGDMAYYGQEEFEKSLNRLMRLKGLEWPLQKYAERCPPKEFGRLCKAQYRKWVAELDRWVDIINSLYLRERLNVQIVKRIGEKARQIKGQIEEIRKQKEAKLARHNF